MNHFFNSSIIHRSLFAFAFFFLAAACGSVFTMLFSGIPNFAYCKENPNTVPGKLIDHLAVKSLTLIDDVNQKRALLTVNNDGIVGLGLFDKNQVQRLTIMVGNISTSIIFSDRSGNKHIVLGEDGLSGAGFGIYSPNGNILAGLTIKDDGNPFFGLADKAGKARHCIGINDNKASYVMMDNTGAKGSILLVENGGFCGLSTVVKSQSAPFAFIGMYDGAPVMTLKDKRNAKVFAGFGPNTGGMLSVQEHGRDIWHAGVQGKVPAPDIDVTDLLK